MFSKLTVLILAFLGFVFQTTRQFKEDPKEKKLENQRNREWGSERKFTRT